MADERTCAFYEANARQIAAQYHTVESPAAPHFACAFGEVRPEARAGAGPARGGARILDVGTGPGRDLAALLAEGYDAFGLEPALALRAEALARHPELAGRLCEGALPDALPWPGVAASRGPGTGPDALSAGSSGAAPPFAPPFDGLLCSAVLQHLPDDDLPAAARALAALLRPGGRLLASLPVGRETDAERRDTAGRLFTGLTLDGLAAHLAREGLVELSRHHAADALGRPGISWATGLFERRGLTPSAGATP